MASTSAAIKIANMVDTEAVDMSKEEYKDFLEDIISDLESKLDCVNEELASED